MTHSAPPEGIKLRETQQGHQPHFSHKSAVTEASKATRPVYGGRKAGVSNRAALHSAWCRPTEQVRLNSAPATQHACTTQHAHMRTCSLDKQSSSFSTFSSSFFPSAAGVLLSSVLSSAAVSSRDLFLDDEDPASDSSAGGDTLDLSASPDENSLSSEPLVLSLSADGDPLNLAADDVSSDSCDGCTLCCSVTRACMFSWAWPPLWHGAEPGSDLARGTGLVGLSS